LEVGLSAIDLSRSMIRLTGIQAVQHNSAINFYAVR
jgi:hypothetical protein